MIDHAALFEQTVRAAEAAVETYAELPPARIAEFLGMIADEIVALGDPLIETAGSETNLPAARLTGERGRTVNQLKLFADVARDGKWKDVRIDPAIEDRQPLRRPDLRRTLIPIGPVAVWAASNFPLAFSVAGGDTASALAAGCPVILKAHPAHPETSRLVAGAVHKAVAACRLPEGVFGMVEGESPDVSLALVRDPRVKAGAFTGSLRAGRALFDAANARPEPIPFFAEMGSVNPVFLLEGALKERGPVIAEGLAASVNMGVGQFCTCPGLVVAIASPALDEFTEVLSAKFAATTAGSMLTPAIAKAFSAATAHIQAMPEVRTTLGSGDGPVPALFETTGALFLDNESLWHEVFGPSTILVRCTSQAEMEEVARTLPGSLTATIAATDDDLRSQPTLLRTLMRKAGRILYNGVPTGVEVCGAMQHGGPYPATTDPRFTSVGTAAIVRFGRPVCFQDFPAEFLPAELR